MALNCWWNSPSLNKTNWLNVSDLSWRGVPIIYVLLNLCAIQPWNFGFVTLIEDFISYQLSNLKKKTLNYSICLHTSGLTFTPHWLIERLFVIISRGSCWLSGIPGLPRVQKLQTTDINNLFKSDDSSVTCWYVPLHRSYKTDTS